MCFFKKKYFQIFTIRIFLFSYLRFLNYMFLLALIKKNRFLVAIYPL